MKLVISLGGSLLTKDFSPGNLEKYACAIKKIASKGHRFVVVVGGGKTAREYIKIADGLNASDTEKDYVAIKATHTNAALFAVALGNCAHACIKTTHDDIIAQYNTSKKIVVCGGTVPGQSTDGVSAKIAGAINAGLLVNATDVSGVYDKNPKEHKNAKKIEKMTYDEFRKILEKNEQAPGKYGLFDLDAIGILKSKKIKLVVVDGTDPEEIINAVEGKHKGTVIQ